MKLFFLAVLTIVVFSGNAWASGFSGASITMPIKARIINLATMPLDKALAFCDERAMACPAIRERYEAQKSQTRAEQE